MSRLACSRALLLLAVVALAPAGQVAAQSLGGVLDRGSVGREVSDRAERAQRMDDRRHERGEDHRALSDAVRRVERRTRGQVLSAERVPYDGRDVNRVKYIDSSGRVRVYMDDPQGQGQGEPRRRDDSDETEL